jgi:putative flippase GtrA
VTEAIPRRGILRQGMRYLVSGGLAAVVDVGLFAAFYPAHVTTLWAAATLSFLVAVIVNYTISSYFVFEAGAPSFRRGFYFLLAATVGLAINVTVTSIAPIVLNLEPVLAKITGIAIAFVVNFAINRQIVFRR